MKQISSLLFILTVFSFNAQKSKAQSGGEDHAYKREQNLIAIGISQLPF